jgi:hypothetical protein
LRAAASLDALALDLLIESVLLFVWLRKAGSYESVDDRMAWEKERGAGTMFSSLV